ncbi:MAG: HlyD family efflux transporter periplasmic adaptor subunit [Pseudomonadota bacterium]|nr:HlyD family efflux transporter periplasmic adaptor subunit [Pseudomonadota bacterium]
MSDSKLVSQFMFGHSYRTRDVAALTCLQRIALPRALRVVAWLLVVTLALAVVLLWRVPWVQTAAGMGRVTTLDPADRVQNVSALVSGRIAEWYVRDTDTVRAGDPLVRIEDLDSDYVTRLETQLDAARRKHAAAKQAADTALLDLARREELFAAGLASRLDYEQASIRVQQLRVSEEQALAELNQAEVNLSRQGSQVVLAPRDGTILHVEAGDVATVVSAGQTLASFLPDGGTRAVELYIDGRDIGLVRPGREVRLEFEGWPAFQFSGMPDLAVGTFAGEVSFVEPNARIDGRFRVLVTERRDADCNSSEPAPRPGLNRARNCGWPPASFVQLGANTRGWILLETVPLGYELWRILNNFPPLAVTPAAQEQR